MAALVRMTIVALCACAASAQYAEERAPRYIATEPKPTPVPILKQINRHNEDGSYTYGYEAADGSFKIETKAPSGEVKGKYGYKDDTGKVRVVEYGANKFGFQPSGEGITVAPPTLVDETKEQERPKSQGGRGQFSTQNIDYDYEEAAAPPPRPRPAPQQQYRPAPPPQQYRPAPQQQQYRPAPQHSAPPTPPKPAFFAGAAPAPAPVEQEFFNPAPAPRPQPRPKQQQFPQNTEIEFQNFPPQRYEPPQYSNSPTPQYNQQFAPQQHQKSQPFSMLDQLLKEFALPQGGAAPLHDITFGSY